MEMINNPHDKFFKSTFSDISITRDFLDNYLPIELRKVVNLGRIKLENGSFIDNELKEYQSDLLFRVDVMGEEGYVYFLMEHKSYQHKPVIFQILKYMLKIWEAKLKEEDKLPIIFPLVIYHGEKRWKIHKSLGEFIYGFEKIPTEVRKYIPNYEYELYDISSYTQEEIKGQAVLRITMEFMKNFSIGDIEETKELIKRTILTLNELDQKEKATELFEICMRYVLNSPQEINIEDILDITKMLSKERSDEIMTLADKLRQEGLERGIERGKESILWKLILKKFPKTPEVYHEKIKKLDGDKLDILGLEILDMKEMSELDRFL